MVSVETDYEGNCQSREEDVALDQSEVHENEEKYKTQASTRVTILQMEVKKSILRIEDKEIFHKTDQNPKSEYRGQVR